MSVANDPDTALRRDRDADRAAARPDVDDPWLHARCRQRATAAMPSSTSSSVSGRGISARASDAEHAAVELALAEQIRNRLRRRPPPPRSSSKRRLGLSRHAPLRMRQQRHAAPRAER